MPKLERENLSTWIENTKQRDVVGENRLRGNIILRTGEIVVTLKIKGFKMAYKIKRTKTIPKGYWEKREMANLRKKYKGKLPPFLEITRAGTRKISNIQKKVHKKNALVYYKENLAKVKKVTKKGLWIEPLIKPSNKNLAYPSGKIIFIPEAKVEHQIYPVFLNLPIWTQPALVIKN